MLRLLAGAVMALCLGYSVTFADELKGTVKAVDKETSTITLTVDGKDLVLPVNQDASIVTVSTVQGKKKNKSMEKLTPIETGLTGVKAGASVTLLTEKVDEKDTVTSVKVSDGKAPAKARKKKT